MAPYKGLAGLMPMENQETDWGPLHYLAITIPQATGGGTENLA